LARPAIAERIYRGLAGLATHRLRIFQGKTGTSLRTSLAAPSVMLAAALIPLIFVFGILVMFALGAWPIGIFSSVVIVGLLVGVAVGLVRFLAHLDPPEQPVHR
jgi:hypothetical protein